MSVDPSFLIYPSLNISSSFLHLRALLAVRYFVTPLELDNVQKSKPKFTGAFGRWPKRKRKGLFY